MSLYSVQGGLNAMGMGVNGNSGGYSNVSNMQSSLYGGGQGANNSFLKGPVKKKVNGAQKS